MFINIFIWDIYKVAPHLVTYDIYIILDIWSLLSYSNGNGRGSGPVSRGLETYLLVICVTAMR